MDRVADTNGHASTSNSDAKNAALDQLFVPAAGSAPLPSWLSPSRFLVADFDPEACVVNLRRFVPLATLQTELQAYLAQLKTKLVEVINEDYGDYIGLSSKLSAVDGSVLRMRKPLVELKDKLNVVQESVKTELLALNHGLKRRKEVATARGLLELLQEVAHVASKVEKLIAEVVAANVATTAGRVTVDSDADDSTAGTSTATPAADTADTSGGDIDGRSRLLERVAAEVSRLSFLAHRGKDLAFLRQLEPRVTASRRELESRLSSCLSVALTSRRSAAVLHCLRAYAELGEVAPAETAIREKAVAPAVAAAVAEHRKQRNARSSSGGDALPQLFAAILAAVQTELGPVLEQVLAPQSGLRALDLLGNAVLAEVQRQLAESMPGVYSPGVPPAFHANYRAALGFLDALEGLCLGRGAVERLRASTAYTAFLRRWNLSVYFSLVFQDIAGELEDAARADKLEPATASVSAAAPQLAVGAALLRCLSRSVQADVFLPQLADRMLRLAMQCCGRYVSWMAAVTAARRDPAAAAAAASSSSSAAGAPADASSNSSISSSLAWVSGLPGDELVVLYQDAEFLAGHIAGQYATSFLTACGAGAEACFMDSALAGAAEASLRLVADAVRSSGQELLTVLSEEIVEQCVGVVRQLKGITATYRMTSKGPPTRYSHYVGGVLTPLKALLDAPKAKTLDTASAQRLAVAVVEATAGRYQGLAEELLSTVRKTEISLKRLKKTRPGEPAASTSAADGGGAAAAAVAEMADSDKICMQLYLDVQEFGAQAGRLPGLSHPLELPAYQALVAAVTPTDPTALALLAIPSSSAAATTAQAAFADRALAERAQAASPPPSALEEAPGLE